MKKSKSSLKSLLSLIKILKRKLTSFGITIDKRLDTSRSKIMKRNLKKS